jgi:deferrochelatase/peroxidase EfeB
MKPPGRDDHDPAMPAKATRRGFLTAAAGVSGALAAGAASANTGPPLTKTQTLSTDQRLPFRGAYQNGIATPVQAQTYFAAFDLLTDKRSDVAALMAAWTAAGERLAAGLPVGDGGDDPQAPAADSGETKGLPANRLTLTFGFGPTIFSKDGHDRYGLSAHRPDAFIDLPKFVGDQLVPQRTGGDLSVQASSDDPQAAFHAVRQLARLAGGVAAIRWVQSGFTPGYAPNQTPRNLMGFKDGTVNVAVNDPKAMARFVWVGDEGGPWMRNGTYMVVRPIRIALEHWDRMKLGFQEQTVGRHKDTGAPIGGSSEFEPLKLDATDKDGNTLIAENAHVRLASPEANDGAQILRRGYAYDNGVSYVAERWPPWRQGMEFDAGLLFICYQRDPRTGFVKLFDRMSKFDMMNQFVTHVGGGLFACPGGAEPGRYIGQALLEA